MNAGRVGIWDWDLETNEIYVAPNLKAMLGYADHEITNTLDDWGSYVYPDDVITVMTAAEDHIAGKTPVYEAEHRMIHKDGSLRWVFVRGTVIRNAAGQPVRMSGTDTDITERKRIEQALEASQAQLQAIFDHAVVGIGLVDTQGRWLNVNRSAQEMLGYTHAEFLQMRYLDITHPDDYATSQTRFAALLAGEVSDYSLEKRYIRKDGSTFWGNVAISAICNHQGRVTTVVGILTDMTERKLADMQIQRSQERLLTGMNRLRQRNNDMLLLNQMSHLLQGCVNLEQAYHVVALIAAQLFEGQTGAIYLSTSDHSQLEVVTVWGESAQLQTTIDPHGCQAFTSGTAALVCASYNVFCCDHVPPFSHDNDASLCVPLVAQDETLGIVHLLHHNISGYEICQRWLQLADMVAGHIALAFTNIALRERLHHQAIHDALTGLYNRRYLDQTLPHELAQASQTESPVGLIMLDIDHFKYFNDTYGHDAGDAMLRIVGNALRQHTRSSDITCRYGGEEFTVVLPGASIEISQQRAEQLRRAISTLSIEHNGQVLGPITISLGVSAFPQHSSNADDLVKAADIALYQAKVQGRNRVMVSDQQPEMLPMVAQTSPYPHL